MKESDYRLHHDKYAAETRHYSMTRWTHPDHVAICEAGDKAIPFLIADLRKWREDESQEVDVHLCLTALWKILRERHPIVPEKSRGVVDDLVDIALKWADENPATP